MTKSLLRGDIEEQHIGTDVKLCCIEMLRNVVGEISTTGYGSR